MGDVMCMCCFWSISPLIQNLPMPTYHRGQKLSSPLGLAWQMLATLSSSSSQLARSDQSCEVGQSQLVWHCPHVAPSFVEQILVSQASVISDSPSCSSSSSSSQVFSLVEVAQRQQVQLDLLLWRAAAQQDRQESHWLSPLPKTQLAKGDCQSTTPTVLQPPGRMAPMYAAMCYSMLFYRKLMHQSNTY